MRFHVFITDPSPGSGVGAGLVSPPAGAETVRWGGVMKRRSSWSRFSLSQRFLLFVSQVKF